MSDDELRGRTPEERRNEIRRRLGAPSDEVLREPPTRPAVPRSDNDRPTVQELLNRMNEAGDRPRDTPRRVRPADAPTETIIGAGRPPSEDEPADAEVTRSIPAVGNTPPDLSDTTTAQRASDESEGQQARETEARDTEAKDTEAPKDDSGTIRVPRTVAAAKNAAARRHAAPRKEKDRHHLLRNATLAGRVLISVACVMALLGTGAVWGIQKIKDGNWNNVDALNSENDKIRDKQLQTGDETYLIVGTDTRSGRNGKIGAGTSEQFEGSARADPILLVNIPADRSRVVAVSFPRDLQVDRPKCAGWNNDDGKYTSDVLPPADAVKLNSVYGDGGPKCTVETLTEMSGLNINHFIAMDFDGFERVVNKVGGVDVCSTEPLYDYELGQILAKAGTKKLKGSKALDYVRARNIESEGTGDYGRIKRQQLFMSSLLRASLSSHVLSNPSTLNGIIDTFIEYSYVDRVDTDDLIQLARSMQGIDAGRVTFLTIPTSGTAEDGSGNEIPRVKDINAIFDAIINDEQLPGEKKAAPPSSGKSSSKTSSSPAPQTPPQPTAVTVNAVSPYSVPLRVLNGTGTTGVAGEISESLVAQGYQVNGVADASENRTTTIVHYGPGQQAAAATVAQMFPGATIQADPTTRDGVEVIVGSDFSGELGTAPAEGTSVKVDELPREAGADDLPNDLTVTNAGDTTCS